METRHSGGACAQTCRCLAAAVSFQPMLLLLLVASGPADAKGITGADTCKVAAGEAGFARGWSCAPPPPRAHKHTKVTHEGSSAYSALSHLSCALILEISGGAGVGGMGECPVDEWRR